MSGNDRREGLTPREKARLKRALVRLIGSTRRPRRSKNLIEVAKELEVAQQLLGGRQAVAREIGISDEMLREFASVTALEDSVKDLVRQGLLTSVDTAYRISMLSKADQLAVARACVQGELSSKGVREVVALRRMRPELGIDRLIGQVKSGKPVTEYVIRLRCPDIGGSKRVRRRFAELVGEQHIRSVDCDGRILTLVIDEEGRRKVDTRAKGRGVTKRELVRWIVDGED